MFQSVFFWDVALCHWVIGTQRVLNHQAPITQWHIAEEWRRQLHHFKA